MVNLSNKTSSDLLTAGLQEFKSEDELFAYLNRLSTADDGESFFDKAKAAVNAWWVRAIIGIANADKFYGYNSYDRSLKEQPAKLVEWQQVVGLTTPDLVKKARSARTHTTM